MEYWVQVIFIIVGQSTLYFPFKKHKADICIKNTVRMVSVVIQTFPSPWTLEFTASPTGCCNRHPCAAHRGLPGICGRA